MDLEDYTPGTSPRAPRDDEYDDDDYQEEDDFKDFDLPTSIKEHKLIDKSVRNSLKINSYNRHAPEPRRKFTA